MKKTALVLIAVTVLLVFTCCTKKPKKADQTPLNIELTCSDYVTDFGIDYKIEDGILYGKGQNSLRLFGDDSAVYVKDWSKIETVTDTNITHLDANGGTLIYMTEDNKVYGLGRTEGVFTSEDFSTIDDRSRQMTPVLLFEDCKFASIGNRFVLFLKQDNTVWFMGESKNGQSTKVTPRIAKPIQIAQNAVSVKAFGYTSSWITEHGDLYLCGDNSFGQIGNGKKGTGFPTLYQDIVKTPFCALGDCVEVTVSGVNDCTVTAKKKDGTVYIWGEDNTSSPQISK